MYSPATMSSLPSLLKSATPQASVLTVSMRCIRKRMVSSAEAVTIHKRKQGKNLYIEEIPKPMKNLLTFYHSIIGLSRCAPFCPTCVTVRRQVCENPVIPAKVGNFYETRLCKCSIERSDFIPFFYTSISADSPSLRVREIDRLPKLETSKH